VLLTELLTPERVRVPLGARDKAGVLRELVELVVASGGGGGEVADVLHAVREREACQSTGYGHGVAIPHGKSPTVARLALVAGSTITPVEFEALDGHPVRLFFLLVSPETAAAAHVRALSRIARLVRRDALRERLFSAQTPLQFYEAVREAEAS
jgi:PTS system nitrogen regulatory IIA component